MRKIYDRRGKDITRSILLQDAINYLPRSLQQRLLNDGRTRRQKIFLSAFFSLLVSGLLTIPLTMAVPFIIELLSEKFLPLYDEALIEVVVNWKFPQAFGLGLYPIIFILLTYSGLREIHLERIRMQHDEILLELAFQCGQDQSSIRERQVLLKS